MRVFLTRPELQTDAGTELLDLCLRITRDGRLDLQEIITLRKWLRANKDIDSVVAVPYLSDIMKRITADGVVDKDEQLELLLAIERVIPTAHRTAAIQARKKRESARREREREKRRIENEREKAEQKRLREEEHARAKRIQHDFTKVAGVTFPNDNGTERQEIISRCESGEHLLLQHDAYNKYSVVATKVLRLNGEQLGHVPEYLAEHVVDMIDDGYTVFGKILEITGGTINKPTSGVNFAIFYAARRIPNEEVKAYVNAVLESRASSRRACQ